MIPPTTYAEWVKYLTMFAERTAADDALLASMESGTFTWVEGVGDKLSKRLAICFQKRLNELQEKFHREQLVDISSVSEFTLAVANLRARFRPLRHLANISIFPDEIKASHNSDLDIFACEMHEKYMEQLKELARHNSHYEMLMVELKKILLLFQR